MPGSPIGLQKEDPTLAEFLKPLGYATAQFGKNHLGDRDEHLPTAHGFDEFYGILYHLNAGEYVDQYDFPTDPEILKLFTQRGVTHAWANADGTQRFEDLGPFGQERQRTLDEETLVESKRFIREAVQEETPFFVWHNMTRMHYRTNLSDEYEGKSGYGLYADGMMELDDDVGELLDLLEELGVDDNTLVMFSTDNGAASNSWPDGGNQPFRGEKGVGGFEGGFRVPLMVKWPGRIPAGETTGEFMIMEDWLPTIMSMLGQPDLREQLLEGLTVGLMIDHILGLARRLPSRLPCEGASASRDRAPASRAPHSVGDGRQGAPPRATRLGSSAVGGACRRRRAARESAAR